MINFIYVTTILIISILLINGINSSISYAPKKIKYITLITLILALIRFIVLILLSLNESPLYIYLLKPIVFLEVVYIPIIGFISLYIFSRNDNIKLNYFYFVAVIFIGIYLITTLRIPVNTTISSFYGYRLILHKDYGMNTLMFIFNSIYLVISIKQLSNKYSNKRGLILVAVSSVLTIGTFLVAILNPVFWGLRLLGELLWIITLGYGLEKFKKLKINN